MSLFHFPQHCSSFVTHFTGKYPDRMSYQFSPATHGLPSLAQYLPPGCKFLSCHDAQNVLRSCSTWRLPNGTLVAPLGGELYQVVEVPTNCDERCSYHEVRCGFFLVILHVSFKSAVTNWHISRAELHLKRQRRQNGRHFMFNTRSFTIFLLLIWGLIRS